RDHILQLPRAFVVGGEVAGARVHVLLQAGLPLMLFGIGELRLVAGPGLDRRLVIFPAALVFCLLRVQPVDAALDPPLLLGGLLGALLMFAGSGPGFAVFLHRSSPLSLCRLTVW